ncbi:uncharacterized protein C8Q71DRAFT_861679 [Rhodofomes roseus]|uniref:Uncharacterized protein n=1 Tax=Rhodofomes roseus TaxID=34475 RepID=A0ABQ8K4A7_9APHY|nr:uncharacterized protein C8Q71DRAFT_861679 [Rhodofomes roseus]KAH9831674.1 hypothetical protein C8Q71DRAFT_861679 [Rhodofomes roseus]
MSEPALPTTRSSCLRLFDVRLFDVRLFHLRLFHLRIPAAASIVGFIAAALTTAGIVFTVLTAAGTVFIVIFIDEVAKPLLLSRQLHAVYFD